MERHWSGFDRLLAFVPDHGGHSTDNGIHGGHGTDLADDMLVSHYWRIDAKCRQRPGKVSKENFI